MLPNSSNVFMAAERAAELSDSTVLVVPSRSLQAGLAAAVSLTRPHRAAENAAAMNEILAAVRTGAVAPAPPATTPRARFREGDAVGFVEDELVVWGDPEPDAARRARAARPGR